MRYQVFNVAYGSHVCPDMQKPNSSKNYAPFSSVPRSFAYSGLKNDKDDIYPICTTNVNDVHHSPCIRTTNSLINHLESH